MVETKRFEGSIGKKSKAAATLLVDLASEVEFFHTNEGEAFALIQVGDHLENWPLKSKIFRQWLSRRFYNEHGSAPRSTSLSDALLVLEGNALYECDRRDVNIRLAANNGRIYLDLADDAWRVVEVTDTGWEVISQPPICFRRARGMLPLPDPVTGGSVEELREYINVASDDDYLLILSWLLASLRPRGPYPVLILHGSQGAAKSTTARVLRSLVDPYAAALRSEPRDARDIMIAANNGWVLALDNLSKIPDWLSDNLCRVTTGGGFATRKLFTDSEEMIFDVQRPVILNGIEEVAIRSDLLDRSLLIYLPEIDEKERRLESEFWSSFEKKRPRILGALLDLVTTALANRDKVTLPAMPRMADFAAWIVSAGTALGIESDSFLRVYSSNREAANDLILDSSLVASAICSFAEKVKTWEGTAKALLEIIDEDAEDRMRRQRDWPQSPRALTNSLRRLLPNLKAVGVAVKFLPKSTGGRRPIRLEKISSSVETV